MKVERKLFEVGIYFPLFCVSFIIIYYPRMYIIMTSIHLYVKDKFLYKKKQLTDYINIYIY